MLWLAPPPLLIALFPITAQFHKLQLPTPPPELEVVPLAVLAEITQLLRLQPKAPPPDPVAVPPPKAVLVTMVQLFNVVWYAPPPLFAAALRVIKQFATVEMGVRLMLVVAPNTPPPVTAFPDVGDARVAPPRRVKPLKMALFVSHAQRTAPGPLVEMESHAPLNDARVLPIHALN